MGASQKGIAVGLSCRPRREKDEPSGKDSKVLVKKTCESLMR
jgi:hypothetical protein